MRDHQISGNANQPRRVRGHGLKLSQMRSPPASPSYPSLSPTASRGLVPSSGRVCSETREASSFSQCRQPGFQTHRAATCFTKPGVCAGAGCGRKNPVIPSVRLGPGSPKTHIALNPSAHAALRNAGGSHHSGPQRAATYFPVSPAQPPPPALVAGPALRQIGAPKYLP